MIISRWSPVVGPTDRIERVLQVVGACRDLTPAAATPDRRDRGIATW
jgi:hypothetical protein